MKCNICGREIDCKFYRHLNSSHKMKVTDYLKRFPEQKEEFEKQKPEHAWNKGLTAKDHQGVAKSVAAITEYSKRSEVRQARSRQMKSRYANGDILEKEVRKRVSKIASDAWVSKVKQMSLEERRETLKAFSEAGNKAQEEKRHLLTPEDYVKLYPFAKGIARYHDCDFCGKKMIAWFGGKPRPKKRFCNNLCYQNFQQEHPAYTLSNNVFYFYSDKMQTEFCLRSRLEIWFAELLEELSDVKHWYVPKFFVPYEYLGVRRRYYPDFVVNGSELIELKSGFIAKYQGLDLVQEKVKSAIVFAENQGMKYSYWQFDDTNLTQKKFSNDERIIKFKDTLTHIED